MVNALATIRAVLPPASQTAFDALFRPRGAWLVDLHDAALDAARRRIPNASWEATRPALAAAGLLPSDLPPDAALLPLAVYRLAVLRARDSAAYEAARERLALGGQEPARITGALLDGYREAAPWQGQAVAFLLTAPWVDAGGAHTSLAGLVAAAWGRPDLAVPVIRPRFFGYPEAVPRVGTPGAVVDRLVAPENWAAEQWVARHGAAGRAGPAPTARPRPRDQRDARGWRALDPDQRGPRGRGHARRLPRGHQRNHRGSRHAAALRGGHRRARVAAPADGGVSLLARNGRRRAARTASASGICPPISSWPRDSPNG